MRKFKKGRQPTLTNPRNAGRKAIHDIGIRHIERARILRASALHLTIKLNRADIQNKSILKIFRRAIYRGRLQGLRIIHFSMEHDHFHIYAEADCNLILAKSMKALGVTLAKNINKFFGVKGHLYKYRYHMRVLKSASDVKNVINYILKNGIKHRRTKKVFNSYNSALVLHDFGLLKLDKGKGEIKTLAERFLKRADIQRELVMLRELLDDLRVFKRQLVYV